MPKMTCWMCGEDFEPDPERVLEWAESGVAFDRTDWECQKCQQLWNLEDTPLEEVNA